MFISELKNIPREPHFAIITTGSIYIPGDERSRTNPGHGYPERYETTITYEAFLNEEEWKAAIHEKATSSFGRRDFVPLIVQVPEVTLHTEIKVG